MFLKLIEGGWWSVGGDGVRGIQFSSQEDRLRHALHEDGKKKETKPSCFFWL